MTRLISIADDVYDELTSLKGIESYSKIIRKLIFKKTNKEQILAFFGKGGINNKKIRELNPIWSKWSEKYV